MEFDCIKYIEQQSIARISRINQRNKKKTTRVYPSVSRSEREACPVSRRSSLVLVLVLFDKSYHFSHFLRSLESDDVKTTVETREFLGIGTPEWDAHFGKANIGLSRVHTCSSEESTTTINIPARDFLTAEVFLCWEKRTWCESEWNSKWPRSNLTFFSFFSVFFLSILFTVISIKMAFDHDLIPIKWSRNGSITSSFVHSTTADKRLVSSHFLALFGTNHTPFRIKMPSRSSTLQLFNSH